MSLRSVFATKLDTACHEQGTHIAALGSRLVKAILERESGVEHDECDMGVP